MTPESEIKKGIKLYLQKLPKCSVFPIATHGTFDPKTRRFRKTTGRIGTPDILCCYRGRFIAFEVKTKNGKLTPDQSLVIDHINECEGFAFVVRSLADTIEVISKINNLTDAENI